MILMGFSKRAFLPIADVFYNLRMPVSQSIIPRLLRIFFVSSIGVSVAAPLKKIPAYANFSRFDPTTATPNCAAKTE